MMSLDEMPKGAKDRDEFVRQNLRKVLRSQGYAIPDHAMTDHRSFMEHLLTAAHTKNAVGKALGDPPSMDKEGRQENDNGLTPGDRETRMSLTDATVDAFFGMTGSPQKK